MKTEEAPSCLQQATPVLGFGECPRDRERVSRTGETLSSPSPGSILGCLPHPHPPRLLRGSRCPQVAAGPAGPACAARFPPTLRSRVPLPRLFPTREGDSFPPRIVGVTRDHPPALRFANLAAVKAAARCWQAAKCRPASPERPRLRGLRFVRNGRRCNGAWKGQGHRERLSLVCPHLLDKPLWSLRSFLGTPRAGPGRGCVAVARRYPVLLI